MELQNYYIIKILQITGSDLSESPNIDRLRKLDISISIGHDKKNISTAEIVVYSDAIPER